MIERWPAWLLVLGPAVLHLILALLVLDPAPYHGGDNATYVALAHSIVERGTYTEIWDPALRPATLYPPVFPLLLASLIKVGATSWLAFKLLSIVISTAAVAMSALWFRRLTTPTLALVGATFVACSPGILAHTHLVLSEIPFWAFTMTALWAMTYITSNDENAWWVAAAAVAAVLAWLTRSAGVPLIAAIAGCLLWQKRWRLAGIFSVIVLPPMLAWMARGRLLNAHGYGSYLMWADPYRPDLGRISVPQLVPRAITNAGHYFSDFAPQALLGSGPAARYSGMVLITVALAWWVIRLVRSPGVLEVWLLLYVGIILIWPETWAGERFVLVMIPALLLFAIDACQALIDHSRTVGLTVAGVAATTLGMIALVSVALQIRNGTDCRARDHSGERFACVPTVWRDIMLVAADVRDQLPHNSVVLSRKPTLFFVLSGYQSVIYPYSAEPDSLFAAARAAHARYLILDNSNLAPLYLHPILRSNPVRFCAATKLSQPEAVLMRFEPATGAPTGPATESEFVSFKECTLPL